MSSGLFWLLDKLNDDFTTFKSKNDIYDITPKPIYLHINSYGGGVFAAFAGVDFIKQSTIPVHTIIEGASASAATILSVVGEKRYMSKHGSMLIHQLSSWMSGKMSDMDDEYKNLEEMMANITQIYLKHTNIKKKAKSWPIRNKFNFRQSTRNDARKCWIIHSH